MCKSFPNTLAAKLFPCQANYISRGYFKFGFEPPRKLLVWRLAANLIG